MRIEICDCGLACYLAAIVNAGRGTIVATERSEIGHCTIAVKKGTRLKTARPTKARDLARGVDRICLAECSSERADIECPTGLVRKRMLLRITRNPGITRHLARIVKRRTCDR